MKTADSLSYASAPPAVLPGPTVAPASTRFTIAKYRLTMLAVGIVALVQFCVFLDDRPVANTFEGRVALTAREMILRSDWLVPRVANVPRLQKPPLAYWLTATLWSVARSEQIWLLRLPSALAGVIAALLMMDLGRRFLGRLGGAVCGMVWVSSYFIVDEYRKAMADPLLAFCALLCVWAWIAADRTRNSPGQARDSSPWIRLLSDPTWRRRLLLLLAYVAIGVGALAKGQMILVHAAIALVPYHLIFRRRVRGGWTHLVGIAIALAIALPWPILIYQKVPGAIDIWLREARGQYATSGEKHSPWYHYLVNLPLTAAPWTLIGLMGLGWPFITRRRADRRLLWPLAWLAMAVLIFSLTPMKKNVYLLPLMPAQTLLIAAPLVAMLRPHATNNNHDPASRALLNWHGTVAVGAVAVLAYMVAKQLVDMSDFGEAFPICTSLAAAIICITLLRMSALQSALLPRFATAALLFAVSTHVIVAWIAPRREELRWRRMIGFSYQVNQTVRRAPLYAIGGIREDMLFYLHRLVDDLGNAEDVPRDFVGFAIVSADQIDTMRSLRYIDPPYAATGRDGTSERAYLCFFPPPRGAVDDAGPGPVRLRD